MKYYEYPNDCAWLTQMESDDYGWSDDECDWSLE